MNIVFDGKERELNYTFNSFKYMQDFDLLAIEDAETKPFKIIPLLETMLLGALNNDKEYTTNIVLVEEFLENYVIEGDISELLKSLMELLEQSSFFKSLQKNNQGKKPKKK